jgi:hypothetical protein
MKVLLNGHARDHEFRPDLLPYHSMVLSQPPTRVTVPLKGQLHEIFDPSFFHQSTPPRALIHGLKPLRIWLRIRRDNRFERRQNLFQRG